MPSHTPAERKKRGIRKSPVTGRIGSVRKPKPRPKRKRPV